MNLLIVAITVCCTIAIQQIYKSATKRRLRNIEQTKAKRAKYIESLQDEIKPRKKKEETEGINIGNTIPVNRHLSYKVLRRLVGRFDHLYIWDISDISITYERNGTRTGDKEEVTHKRFNQEYEIIKKL